MLPKKRQFSEFFQGRQLRPRLDGSRFNGTKPCLLSSFIFNEILKDFIFYIHESVYVAAAMLVMYMLFCCNSFRKAIAKVAHYEVVLLPKVPSFFCCSE